MTHAFEPASLLPVGDGNDLHALCDGLRQRGWPSRVVSCQVCGDEDVRLQVAGPGVLAVELLGPLGGGPCGDRWQAVRITPDERIVWCGPPRSCPPRRARQFIEDLLQRDVEELASRYQRLG